MVLGDVGIDILDLGIKVNPRAVCLSKSRPVGRDGAHICHQWEGYGGGVRGSRQSVLHAGTEDIGAGCHGLQQHSGCSADRCSVRQQQAAI